MKKIYLIGQWFEKSRLTVLTTTSTVGYGSDQRIYTIRLRYTNLQGLVDYYYIRHNSRTDAYKQARQIREELTA